MKICIVRSDRMGDMILTLPVIQGIKQKNPQAIIHVIASQKNVKRCNEISYGNFIAKGVLAWIIKNAPDCLFT
mgnify:CR=1 FL=1